MENLVKRNIAFSLILQIVTIISGFVIPRIILEQFGSNVNGLVSSINQFLSYISLLEGGLGGVIRAALYKPLKDNDSNRINGIINAAESFFKRIALIYVIYVCAIIVLYPRLIDSGFSTSYCSALILVLSFNLFIQYYFSISYRILLTADRKVYIVSLTQTVIVILNMIAVIVCAFVFKDIVIIKLAGALIFLLQPIVFTHYVNTHFSIDKRVPKDEKAISQRWDGFAVNLAAFIHNNTDIVILTVFSTLTNVSIYSIYAMIVGAVKSLVVSVSSSIEPSFGRALASDDNGGANSFFDKYSFIVGLISSVVFSCTVVLITPFVDVYTNGISDANYHQQVFGFILVLAEYVYCFRDPYINVAYSSGLYKAISKQALLEALLNIIVSIVLVPKYGLLGVAIGTLVAMVYRMLDQVVFVKNNVLFRSITLFLKSIFTFAVSSAFVIVLSSIIFDLDCSSYPQWISLSIKVLGLAIIVFSSMSFVFYKDLLNNIYSSRRRK